jgi:hypothetical protein
METYNDLKEIFPTKPTQQDLINRAIESENAIEGGMVISLEDLEEEMKSW